MQKKLVLLVEDIPAHEKLALRALAMGEVSHSPFVVRDGQEALEYLFYQGKFSERPIKNPDLILLDLKLPKVDGLDVLKKIRSSESTKFIPVIILTSSRAEMDLIASFANGANSYLLKPVDVRQLAQSIHNLLVHKLEQNVNFE